MEVRWSLSHLDLTLMYPLRNAAEDSEVYRMSEYADSHQLKAKREIGENRI